MAERDLHTDAPRGLGLIRKLGAGSMASVYLARDEQLRRLVALKVLKPELSSDPISAERFERESRAAARLSHPNVTQVYSVGRLKDHSPYICMEFIEGRNLEELVRCEGPFEPERAISWLIQLADALACSHENGIIHRDVKPANVIIDDSGSRAVLTDFGVAGIRETGSEAVTRLTKTGEQLGDPRYMSPEQQRGEAVTPQSDVYSFGVVAYELLTGRNPFGKDANENIASAHLRAVPINLHHADERVDPVIADVLMRCLAKEPAHRPRIRTVLDQLRGSGNDRKPDSQTDASPTFLSELRRRRVSRTAIAYTAAMIVFLQGADAVVPATPLPAWSYTVLVTLFLCGLPIVVVLSWLFDFDGGRIQRTESLTGRNASARMRLAQVLGVVASIAVAAMLGWWMLG